MSDRARAVGATVAGPVLIVASVLVVLHLIAFSGLVSRQNPDVLSLWLPTYCLMGKSLAAGHIPAWNPFVMGGTPFAADPQSGWMYLPVMLLFSATSCGQAIRWFIVLQPLLAGLGIYWFVRGEGLSRVAATVGGLALALPVAGSEVALSMPFSATIAWTAITLAAASRVLRARTWPARLAWMAATSIAWGQLAAAHLSNGLVLGTAALVFYLVARLGSDVRRGNRAPGEAAALVLLLVAAVPLVNLAYFLPRLMYLPRTSLGLGYGRLQQLSRAYSGMPPVGSLPGRATRPTLPLRFVASPGLYLGATALALSCAGWRSRRRHLGISFAAFGLCCYLASLHAVATFVADHLRTLPFADFYLREPERFAFGIPIAVAVLAALGVEGWMAARSWRDRAAVVAPAVAVWLVLPLAFHADVRDLRLFFVAAAVAAIVLTVVARRPALIALVPVALAGELVANGLAGQSASARPAAETPLRETRLEPLYPLSRPDVNVGAYLRPGPIARVLERSSGGRSLSIDPGGWDPRGLHVHQAPRSWGLMAMQQSMVFRFEEAQGYSATEEQRFWRFIRAVDPRRIKYNAAYLEHPSPLAMDVLDVGWIVAPTDQPPGVGNARPAVRQGRWTLYRVTPKPRAEVFTSWVPVQDGAEALAALVHGGADTQTTAVVELGGFGLRPQRGPPGGTATYRWRSPQEAVIEVRSPATAALVVRNTYDPNWHAELDGRPVSLLHMNYVLQGLFVPKGRHTVVLRYDDPTIGYGLLGSGLALLLLLGPAVILARRGRTRPSRSVAESPADADSDRPLVEAP
jgi:hypothetical protein